MSVTNVTELFMERGGKKGLDLIQVFRSFQVFTDSMSDGPLTVMNAPGLPVPGEELPEDPTLYCTGLDPQPDTDGVTWKVKALYDKKPPSTGTGGALNPWDLDPVINFGFIMRSKVLDKCYAVGLGAIAAPVVRGLPTVKVTNSALQPFDPPAMVDEALLLIAISRNIKGSSFLPTNVRKYQNTINIDAANVTIAGIAFKQFTCWCRDYKTTQAWTADNVAYTQETIEVVIDEETWLRKIVDMGLIEGNVPSGGYLMDYIAVKDTEGNQVNEPVMLDGAGRRNGAANPPVLLTFHALWEETWTGWLPTTY
jgi:hypothetical protein